MTSDADLVKQARDYVRRMLTPRGFPEGGWADDGYTPPGNLMMAMADRIASLQAEVAALQNIHSNDMNDLVLMGLARDEEHARAQSAESALSDARKRLEEIGEIAAKYKGHQYRWLEVEMNRIAAIAKGANNG